MPKRRKKEAGKVIVKKRVHRAPFRVRWDILLVVAVVLLIVIGVAYTVMTQKPSKASKEVNPSETLYKGLKVIFKDKNTTANLDLYYQVRGNVETSGKIISIKDIIQFRVFYYNQTIGKGNNTKTIAGFAGLPIGAPYVYSVLNLTGYTYSLNNASEIILNPEHLKSFYNISVKTSFLGSERIVLKGLRKSFQAKHYRYEYEISNEGKIKHVVIDAWYITEYELPGKVIISVDNYKVSFQLMIASLSYIRRT